MPNRDGSALASNGELLIAENGLHSLQDEYIDAIFQKRSNSRSMAALRIVMSSSRIRCKSDHEPRLPASGGGPSHRTLCGGCAVCGGHPALAQQQYAYIDVGPRRLARLVEQLEAFAERLKQVGNRHSGGNSKVDGSQQHANYNVLVGPFMKADQKVMGHEVRSLKGWYDWNDHIEEQSFANALREELITARMPIPANLACCSIPPATAGWAESTHRPEHIHDLRTFVERARSR